MKAEDWMARELSATHDAMCNEPHEQTLLRVVKELAAAHDALCNVRIAHRRQLHATLKFRRRAKHAEAQMQNWINKYQAQSALMIQMADRQARTDALAKERDEMRANVERLQVALHESTLLIDDTGQCDCREDIMCRFCLFIEAHR